jgi:hypothetical protein
MNASRPIIFFINVSREYKTSSNPICVALPDLEGLGVCRPALSQVILDLDSYVGYDVDYLVSLPIKMHLEDICGGP